MVKNSEEPGPLHQSRYPVSIAHASSSGFGAGSQSLYALNETLSPNNHNVPMPGGPRDKSGNIHNDSIAFDAAESHGASEKAAVPPPVSAMGNVHGETSAPIEYVLFRAIVELSLASQPFDTSIDTLIGCPAWPGIGRQDQSHLYTRHGCIAGTLTSETMQYSNCGQA